MAWRKGVLICAAPEVIYAEDLDGDGRADRKEVLFRGFATENYQARVNGLAYGLDNWVYGPRPDRRHDPGRPDGQGGDPRRAATSGSGRPRRLRARLGP